MTKEIPWHENAQFWETAAPFMFGEPSWAAAVVDVENVINLLNTQPGAELLDLGCGPGRHSLELARRGYHVTGVDIIAAHLEKARRQAEAEGLFVDWIQEDMRRFSRPNSFDVALSLFTSFGYFDHPDENRQVLLNVHRSLKTGGKLVIELMGKEVLARILQARDWAEQDGLLVLQERKISENWARMENRWILIQDQARHEFNVSHWIYSAAELIALLKESGFRSVHTFGNLEGAAYDHTARRLVAVAHK